MIQGFTLQAKLLVSTCLINEFCQQGGRRKHRAQGARVKYSAGGNLSVPLDSISTIEGLNSEGMFLNPYFLQEGDDGGGGF